MKFHVGEDKLIPSVPGIYFIFSNRTIIYIGQSRDLSKRVTSDRLIRDFLKFGITHFKIIPTTSDYTDDDDFLRRENERLELEAMAINFFNPPLNKRMMLWAGSRKKKPVVYVTEDGWTNSFDKAA